MIRRQDESKRKKKSREHMIWFLRCIWSNLQRILAFKSFCVKLLNFVHQTLFYPFYEPKEKFPFAFYKSLKAFIISVSQFIFTKTILIFNLFLSLFLLCFDNFRHDIIYDTINKLIQKGFLIKRGQNLLLKLPSFNSLFLNSKIDHLNRLNQIKTWI